MDVKEVTVEEVAVEEVAVEEDVFGESSGTIGLVGGDSDAETICHKPTPFNINSIPSLYAG